MAQASMGRNTLINHGPTTTAKPVIIDKEDTTIVTTMAVTDMVVITIDIIKVAINLVNIRIITHQLPMESMLH